MKDFKKYQTEIYSATKNFCVKDVLQTHYLPNYDELHSMVYGYKDALMTDQELFDTAQGIDYQNYESELWKLGKTK